MNITITLTDSASKFIINNLYPLYLHDLSEIWGTIPNRYGVFEEDETQSLQEQNKVFDIWWEKAGILYPYLIKENDIPIGFALVATPPYTPSACEFYLNEFLFYGLSVVRGSLNMRLRKSLSFIWVTGSYKRIPRIQIGEHSIFGGKL